MTDKTPIPAVDIGAALQPVVVEALATLAKEQPDTHTGLMAGLKNATRTLQLVINVDPRGGGRLVINSIDAFSKASTLTTVQLGAASYLVG